MANGFEFYGDPKTEETQKFCQVDKFFDCLNGHNKDEYIKKKTKPETIPQYR